MSTFLRNTFTSRSNKWSQLENNLDSKQPSTWRNGKFVSFLRPQKKTAFRIIIACLCVCVFIRAIDAVILPVILPDIAKELKASSVDVYWSGSSYLFTMTIVQPIFGGLAEAMGRRTCTIWALSYFVAGSVLCATAQNITWLIWARAFQGIGAGGIDVMVDIITVDLVPLKKRPKYIAITQMAGAFGMVSGMIFGAVLVQSASWRIVFWINLPITIPPAIFLMMFLRLRFVPKPFFEQVASMDWTGILLLSGGLVGILWAIFSGGVVFPWASGRVLAAMIFGIIGVVTFILHQAFVAGKYTKQKPIIPLRLFGTRTASIGYYIVLIHAVILSSIANYYPLYLYVCKGQSVLGAAVTMLPSSIIPLTCAALGGWFLSKIKRFKWLNVFGLVFFVTGLIGIKFLTENSSKLEIVLLQFIYSVGAGVLFPGRIMAVQAAQKDDDDVPMATALISFGLSLGQCFGVAFGGTVYQNVWNLLVKRDVANGSIPKQYILMADVAEKAAHIIEKFPKKLRDTYRHIMAVSISRIWLVMIFVAATALLASFFSRDLSLDRDTKTKFGLEGFEDDNGSTRNLVETDAGEGTEYERVSLRETQTQNHTRGGSVGSVPMGETPYHTRGQSVSSIHEVPHHSRGEIVEA